MCISLCVKEGLNKDVIHKRTPPCRSKHYTFYWVRTFEFDFHSSQNKLFFLIYCEVNIVATNIVYSPPITNDSTHPSAFPTQPFTPLLMTSSVCSYALITLSYSTPATPINTTEQFTCDTTWMAQPLFQLLRYTNCLWKYDKFHYIHLDWGWNTSIYHSRIFHVLLPSVIPFSDNSP